MQNQTTTTKDPRAIIQDIDQRLSLLHHTLWHTTKKTDEAVISGSLLNVQDIQNDLNPLLQYCEDTVDFLQPLREKLESNSGTLTSLFDLLINIDESGKIQEYLFNQLLNEEGQVKNEFISMGKVTSQTKHTREGA